MGPVMVSMGLVPAFKAANPMLTKPQMMPRATKMMEDTQRPKLNKPWSSTLSVTEK